MTTKEIEPVKSNAYKRLKDIISEKIKEKIGRGRPAKHSQKEYNRFEGCPANTRRGKQNYIYAAMATSVLRGEKERFAYLLEPKYRITILAELGRINPPWTMVSLASDICKMRMNTAKAVGLCRRRRGKGQPDLWGLAKKIKRTIQDYRTGHPNISEADVATALRIAQYG
jgi:hypothetical protein